MGVRRLGAPRIPISYARPLEDEVRITVPRIVETAVKMCEHTTAPKGA